MISQYDKIALFSICIAITSLVISGLGFYITFDRTSNLDVPYFEGTVLEKDGQIDVVLQNFGQAAIFIRKLCLIDKNKLPQRLSIQIGYGHDHAKKTQQTLFKIFEEITNYIKNKIPNMENAELTYDTYPITFLSPYEKRTIMSVFGKNTVDKFLDEKSKSSLTLFFSSALTPLVEACSLSNNTCRNNDSTGNLIAKCPAHELPLRRS